MKQLTAGLVVGLLLTWEAGAAPLVANIQGRVEYGYNRSVPGVPDVRLSNELRFNRALVPNVTSSFAIAAPAVDDAGASVVTTVGDGWMQVDGVAFSAVGGVPRGVEAGGSGRFSLFLRVTDTITIDSPRLTGTPGRADLGFFLDGVLSAGADAVHPHSRAFAAGYASLLVNFYGLDTVGSGFGAEVDTYGDLYPRALRFGETYFGAYVDFIFGTPFSYLIDFYSEGRASASSDHTSDSLGYPGAASLVSDFGNTISWAGVNDLRDADGNLVMTFTAFSGNGADFRFRIFADDNGPPPGTVPEPSTMLLLFTGLAALSCRRFHPRARH
jgi:hypothetical protein